MMNLFNERVRTASCAGQGVAHQRLVDKLSLVQSGHTVQIEALQADHVTLCTLKHQNWTHDVSAGDAGDAACVGHDQVQRYRCVIITGGVSSTFQVEFRHSAIAVL